MKLEKDSNTVEHNGLTDSGEFSIAANAHAFQILSSGVYTNKLRAPVRELCCNAFDAHAAHGNTDTPIKITLPKKKDTIFSVEDFGPGLSDEDVENLYSTYFKSTRNTSNAYTGGFGIGSKSPFAVVDRFNVESRFNGELTTFEAFLDKDRMPHIRQLSKQKTDISSGLTISFNVPTHMVDEFNQQAKEVMRAFDSPYEYSGKSEITPYSQVAGVRRGNTLWPRDTYNRHPMILMGNIAYPLGTYESKVDLGEDKLTQAFLRSGLYINVPVGVLNVAASREDLSYDKKTLTALPKIIKAEIAAFAKSIYHECFTPDKSKMDSAIKLRKVCHSSDFIRHETDILKSVAELGEWPSDITTFVADGLTSLLPTGVKVAYPHPMLSDLDHFVGRGRGGPRGAVVDGNTIDYLLDMIDRQSSDMRKQPKGNSRRMHGSPFMGGYHDEFMHPGFLSVLARPLMSFDADHVSNRTTKIAPVPHWNISELVTDRDDRWGSRHGGQHNVERIDRQALRLVFDALARTQENDKNKKDRDNDRFYGHRGNFDTVVVYPDVNTTLEQFVESIRKFNESWGTNFDVGDIKGLTNNAQKTAPAEIDNAVYGELIFDLDDASTLDMDYLYDSPTESVAVSDLKEPFLYTNGNHHAHDLMEFPELLELFTKLGAPKKLVMLSPKALKELESRGVTEGVEFSEYLKNTLVPWAVENGAGQHAGYYKKSGQYQSYSQLEEIFTALQKHPQGAKLPIVLETEFEKSDGARAHEMRAVTKFLHWFGVKLPEKPDPFSKVFESYPFMQLTQLQRVENINEVISYISAVDTAREAKMSHSSSPQI